MKTPPGPPWFLIQRPKPQARLRLFCLPFAGGAASVFRNWGDALPAHIEVCAIQPPGRESRIREPLYRDLRALVQTLGEEIRPLLDLPFAVFGHSMGATIGLELARYLRRQAGLEPVHFFASARRAPHTPERPLRHVLPDDLLIEELRQMGGTPDAVLRDAELMGVLLPIVRADLQLLETYVHEPAPPLRCPLTALRGLHDREVTDSEAAAWREHTSNAFVLRMLAAGHFFLGTHREQVLAWIAEALG